ncbi:oxygen-independent coproporphyrinogen III oxidase [Flavobacterium sp.]|uniref:oxygen-independent coproporphyrinogen III oxidase n=1 Tax=Flavobacterium sp. TaxID=239 RepID=UPI00352794D5
MKQSLIQKYNVPGPRYTSYPTVPYWDTDAFSLAVWKEKMLETFSTTNAKDGISLYIHLPFCESLCTFCGCHKRITKRHEVENPYITAVLKEWNLYCALFNEKPVVKEIHLGGGTPTFFSPENLKHLINSILSKSKLADNYEFSFEGHPNNTTKEHLQTLYNLGFRRVSFGVQDYAEKVQKAIHRIQPFQNVAKITLLAKEIGYTSISHDLVFGLPFQTLDNVMDTINKTNSLNPDRIAFYSYAHVPWIKGNGQRGFKDEDVPKDAIKRQLYEQGKLQLSKHGFEEIGMDHFALKTDSMYNAFKTNSLHRNFMGYTTTTTKLMIGLGVSSISDSWNAFAQNEKDLETYYECLAKNELPIHKGHLLNDEDLVIRQHILNIMCTFTTNWTDNKLFFNELPEVLTSLQEMETDGLLQIDDTSLRITAAGKPFVRNVCMAFDLRLKRNKPETALFSMTI